MNQASKIITEQLDLLTLQTDVARLMLQESQERSLFRPCKLGTLEGCWVCRIKRYILRKRYQ